jgi:hypothetical protein
MELQEQKPKKRIPIQFYVEIEDKERADNVVDHHGDLAHMARTGFLEQIAKRERERYQNEKEKLAS